MALIVGHSQVKYFSEYLTDNRVFSLCFPGYQINDLMHESAVFDIVPDVSVVAIMIGANDVPTQDATTIVNNIQALCEKIRETNDKVTVVLSSILPRAENQLRAKQQRDEQFNQRFNATVRDVNFMLKAVPSEVSWVKFVDHQAFYCSDGSVKRCMLSRDGLHLSLSGTDAVASRIEETCVSLMKHLPPIYKVEREASEYGPLTYRDVVQLYKPAKVKPRTTTITKISVRPMKSVAKEVPIKSRSNTDMITASKRYLPKKTTPSFPNLKKTLNCISLGNRFATLQHHRPKFRYQQQRRVQQESKTRANVTVATCQTELDSIVEWIKDTSRRPAIRPGSLLGGGSDGDVKLFSNLHTPLTAQETIAIFEECADGLHGDRISTATPLQVKGGEVYVIDTDALPHKGDVRVDGYSWINDGKRKQPKKNPKICKTFFKIKLHDKSQSTIFQKYVFESLSEKRYVIVQYLGDEKCYEPMPHGNSKNSNSVYRRTCPSVFNEIKNRVNDITSSANVIEKESKSKADCGFEIGIKTARNLSQVKNHLYKARNQARLGNDDIYNLVELSYELENFNKQIDVFPSLVCVSGMDEILNEFNELLMYNSDYPLRMYYDTTYKLGDLFVSVLSYQHIIFEGSRVIPLAFMMHDKRDAKFHERFFDVLKCHVPNLERANPPIICDREPGIKLAIEKILPNLRVIHCWNHLKRDVKHWLLKLKATQDDISVYIDHVDKILRCENEESCLNKINELEQLWSQEFRKYFHKHLKSAIIENAGRWILEGLKIYNHYSGITTNPAECMNNVIKSIQKRRELPVDLI